MAENPDSQPLEGTNSRTSPSSEPSLRLPPAPALQDPSAFAFYFAVELVGSLGRCHYIKHHLLEGQAILRAMLATSPCRPQHAPVPHHNNNNDNKMHVQSWGMTVATTCTGLSASARGSAPPKIFASCRDMRCVLPAAMGIPMPAANTLLSTQAGPSN